MENGVEVVEHRGDLYALILRAELRTKGVRFFTAEDAPIQLGVLTHAKGTVVKPHVHREQPKTVSSTQEVLHVQFGAVEIDFYAGDGAKFKTVTLRSGDTILLVSGGHGLKVLEDTKIIEAKQGPYLGPDQEKLFLAGEA